MGHITYSNGNITASSITTAGRMSNKIASMYASNKVAGMLGEPTGTDLRYVPQVDTDSYYLNLGDVVKTKMSNFDKDKKVKAVLKISDTIILESNKKAMVDIAETLNLRDTKALNLENEIIADGFVSLAAKRYFGRKVVEDGTILAKPKMKSTGISLVSKKTPKFLRDALAPVLEIILDGTNSDLNKYIKGVRAEFGELSPTEFARSANVNNLSYSPVGFKYKRQKEDGKFLTAPMGSHASLEFNRYIKENNMTGKYNPIEVGEAVSYVYINEPNEKKLHGSLAWNDPNFTDDVDLKDFVSYAEHFHKDFEKKVEIVVKPIGWNIYNKTEEMEVW